MEKEALEEEINDIDSELVESEEISDEDDKEVVDDDPLEDDQKKDVPEEVNPQGKSRIKKWKLFIILGIILATSVLGITFAPNLLKKNDRDNLVNVNIDDDNLSEKDLSPFFFPSQEGNSSGTIRMDLSVIWDGLAEIRFEKKELQIRSGLYGQLLDIVRENDDLNSMIPFLENKIGAVFRESLDVRDLAIKIKEIRYI